MGNLSTIYSFINKCLLARYYISNIILGAWVTAMNTQIHCMQEAHVLVEKTSGDQPTR